MRSVSEHATSLVPDVPESPCVAVDVDRVRENIQAMQRRADECGVDLWPHVKTHKIPEIARWQLEAGAAGLTCAKISEAEVLLASGAKRMFLAFGLVDERLAPRLRGLADSLDELRLAVTGGAMLNAIERVVASAGLAEMPVMLAVDTGLDREGVRSPEEGTAVAKEIAASRTLRLAGLYTHEGMAYGESDATMIAQRAFERIDAVRRAIDPQLPVWPGCSVTARDVASLSGVGAIRPGTYVFGDLLLAQATGSTASWAAKVISTVVDRPRPGLALIDAGSKTLALDRTRDGIHARSADGRDLEVFRCSEEHGFLRGEDVDRLEVGERLALIPAHICPVINLASKVAFVRGGRFERWVEVAARGCVV